MDTMFGQIIPDFGKNAVFKKDKIQKQIHRCQNDTIENLNSSDQ